MIKGKSLNSTMVIGAIIWALLITLFATISKSGYQDDAASKQLVSGLIPTISLFFIFKLIPTVKILKMWKETSNKEKLITLWGLISADFIFSCFCIYKYKFNKK